MKLNLAEFCRRAFARAEEWRKKLIASICRAKNLLVATRTWCVATLLPPWFLLAVVLLHPSTMTGVMANLKLDPADATPCMGLKMVVVSWTSWNLAWLMSWEYLPLVSRGRAGFVLAHLLGIVTASCFFVTLLLIRLSPGSNLAERFLTYVALAAAIAFAAWIGRSQGVKAIPVNVWEGIVIEVFAIVTSLGLAALMQDPHFRGHGEVFATGILLGAAITSARRLIVGAALRPESKQQPKNTESVSAE